MRHNEIKKRNNKIVKLIKQGVGCFEIAKKHNLTIHMVYNIAVLKNIRFNRSNHKENKKFAKRRKEIVKLIKQGIVYPKIAKKYNITKQRVHQIAKFENISPVTIRHEKYKKIIKKIDIKIKNGKQFNDVCKNYNISTLRNHGLKNIRILQRSFRKTRNKKISHLYKNGLSAKDILKKHFNEINNIQTIYNINNKLKSQRAPIAKRKKYYKNENKKILKLIKTLKNKRYTFQEIADILNGLRLTTICGKSFSSQLVCYNHKKNYSTR